MDDDRAYDSLRVAQTVGRERMNKRGKGPRFLPGSKNAPPESLPEVPVEVVTEEQK